MKRSRKRRPAKPGLLQRIRDYFRGLKARREENARKRYKKKIARRHHRDSIRREKKMQAALRKAERARPGHSFFNFISLPSFSKSALFQFVNSLILFILSYVLIYLLYQIIVILTAGLWELDSVLYYYDLAFNDFSPKWTRFNIIVITISGPVVCLVIGILLYFKVFNMDRVRGYTRLFVLWLSFHAINHFLGALVSGISTDEGFGYVVNWLYVITFFKLLLALISLFMLGIIGYFSAGRFLETGMAAGKASPNENRAMILRQAIIPWILGSLLLMLVKIPNNFNFPYETIMFATMGFILVPMYFNKDAAPRSWILKNYRQRHSFRWLFFLLMLVFLSFFRIELDRGLHFDISVDISFSIKRA